MRNFLYGTGTGLLGSILVFIVALPLLTDPISDWAWHGKSEFWSMVSGMGQALGALATLVAATIAISQLSQFRKQQETLVAFKILEEVNSQGVKDAQRRFLQRDSIPDPATVFERIGRTNRYRAREDYQQFSDDIETIAYTYDKVSFMLVNQLIHKRDVVYDMYPSFAVWYDYLQVYIDFQDRIRGTRTRWHFREIGLDCKVYLAQHNPQFLVPRIQDEANLSQSEDAGMP